MSAKFKPVKSSNIRGMRLVDQQLEVLFLNDSRWGYSPVTQETFDELIAAESVRKAFNSTIKANLEIEAVQLPTLTGAEVLELMEIDPDTTSEA